MLKIYPIVAISCDSDKLFNDLVSVCRQFTNDLIKDLKRNKRVVHRIKIEVYSKRGRNFNTIAYLMAKDYHNDKQILNTVLDKRFPFIADKVPNHIIGFKVMALDFRKVCDNTISNITKQFERMTV